MADKFCVVPWIHLNPEPTGAIKPCCAYFDGMPYPMLQNVSLEEVWNSAGQRKLRRQFLNNEVPKGCATCTNKEDSNGHSFRMAMNERFAQHIEPAKKNTKEDGTYDKFELVYWDFRFSNVCNFKCRMCGHACSSSWYEDRPDKSRPKILDKSYQGRDMMEYVDKFIDVVEEVYFAGGEPLMMPEHYKVLDKLIEHKRFDVFLRYNTNLSTIKYKSYDLINTWKRFEKVQVFVSLDGIGENAEYSRHGTNWEKIESNIIALVENDLDILISTTINIFNVFYIPQFIDRLVELNIPLSKIITTNLMFPSYYKIAILPDNLKDQLREKYTSHLTTLSEGNQRTISNLYDAVYYYLNIETSSQDVEAFYKTTIELDAKRNEDITVTIPEYKDWFVELKKLYGKN